MQRFPLSYGFGSRSSQSELALTLSKLDLMSWGLTPSTDNTAESLLVAMLLQLISVYQGRLTDELGRNLTDSTGEPLTYDNTSNDWLIEVTHWRRAFVTAAIGAVDRSYIIAHFRDDLVNLGEDIDPNDF